MSQDQTIHDGYLSFSDKLSEADQLFRDSEFEECLSKIQAMREMVEEKIEGG